MSAGDPLTTLVHEPFLFVGDALCLDFLNTWVQGRESLVHYASFLRWLAEAGLVTEEDAATIQTWHSDDGGAAALAAAKSLRRLLRETIDVFRHGDAVPDSARQQLNLILARSPTRTELVFGAESRLRKRFRSRCEEPADLLAPMAESAADLLTNVDPTLVRKCSDPTCTIIFLDRTKNHRRRWCSMAWCGNRAKVAAHRARQKNRMLK